MEFVICDRESIERGLVVRAPYVVISVRDPDTPPVALRRPPGFVAALELAFHDAEPADGLELPAAIRLMREEDAIAIWEFLQRYRRRIGAVVCHCEQGMSRSPAIAWALAEAFGDSTRNIRLHYQPNEFVYRLLRRTIEALRSP